MGGCWGFIYGCQSQWVKGNQSTDHQSGWGRKQKYLKGDTSTSENEHGTISGCKGKTANGLLVECTSFHRKKPKARKDGGNVPHPRKLWTFNISNEKKRSLGERGEKKRDEPSQSGWLANAKP